MKNLIPQASTANLLDIVGDVLTALRERNHEMTPVDGSLRGDLADIGWLLAEGVWGVVYHTSAGAELTARDYGRRDPDRNEDGPRLPRGYDCHGCGRSYDGCSISQNKDAGPGDCCEGCDHTASPSVEEAAEFQRKRTVDQLSRSYTPDVLRAALAAAESIPAPF